MSARQLIVAAIVAVSIWAPIATSAQDKATTQTSAAIRLPVEGWMPSLGGANEWLNSPTLTAADLRGRVVLFDIWTYTCVNSLRTLPYVRAWAEKYKDRGLVVIGVSDPEFEFERNIENVRQAAKALRIEYPIAIDNDYAIWTALNNHYWPALYLVDAEGRIRYQHFGEGAYEETERIIQQLVAEAGAASVPRDLVTVHPRGLEVAADWKNLRSPESYLGYAQVENFASPRGLDKDKRRDYSYPAKLRLNQWALSGEWTARKDAPVLNKPNGRVAYRFHARDLNLVMAPITRGAPVRFRVLLDGKSPGDAHGTDVDEDGNGIATEQRTYQLIRQQGPIADRLFEIEFLSPDVGVFDFTFG